MRPLSEAAHAQIAEIARRHEFSVEAVTAMAESLGAGLSGMAQFNHREFGGRGQWMRGGMTMLSDMSDRALRSRVDHLCDELSRLLDTDHAPEPLGVNRHDAESRDAFAAGSAGRHWPAELGRPSSTGAQNDMRYAYFAQARRLAIDRAGAISIYDTLDHRITGVAQAQTDRGSLRFSSQHGVVDVAALPVVSADPARDPEPSGAVARTIDQLADLNRRGILNDREFAIKKAELLARL